MSGVKRGDRVRQSSRRAAGSPRKASNLRDSTFDQERLARQTYLTIPEFCAYARFTSENAAYQFLSRHPEAVPKCRRGRAIFVLRRDYDRFVQPSRGKRVEA